MYGDKDLSNGFAHGGENSQTKLSQQGSEQNKENPDDKTEFPEKSVDFLRDSEKGRDGSASKPLKMGNSGHQELTLSYLCENPKSGIPEKETPGKNLLNSIDQVSYKGKEVVSESPGQEERWVERDFLSLSDGRRVSSKREIEEEIDREGRDKKPKLETLNLSLALPDVSLSLTASNPVQNGDIPIRPMPTRSIQSLAPSNNNTQTTCSNDFTAASLSYSYSHPFSHNPSCSLENYEYSVGSHRRDCDQIWHCGEGTNGSVHSRFKPIGDGGVSLSNHGGGSVGYALMHAGRPGGIRDAGNNSLHRTTSSDNQSFFLPSELPARPRLDTQSSDSRGRGVDHVRSFDNSDGGRSRKPSRPERILRDIVTDSIPAVAQVIQELPEETIELTKEYLKNLIAVPERREELAALQSRLERRSDFSMETLSKAQKDQLDMLVAIKTGLSNYLSGKNRLPTPELMEIFLFMRCRNTNCKSLLPVDDCDCKICSANKGFCRECMCPVCLSFDCANNTCSWVGCDVCSHWCHAACGIQKRLIKPGPSLKGPSGTSEMQFHCIGCGHASEMFGFVKDVFLCCAKDWGLESLIKELDCVRKIFMGSEDFKGKDLQSKAEELLSKLERKMMSPSDACNSITQFFNFIDGLTEYPASTRSSKDLASSQGSLRKHTAPPGPSALLPPKYATYNMSSSSLRNDLLPRDLHQGDLKASLLSGETIEDDFLLGKSKKDGFENLETVVRIKELEARMFQGRADDARREAESYRRMVRASSEKMEEEYAEKLAKLCLQETEDRRRKKLEELKVLENSRCDYYNMKMRMQAEIAGLLERMEATKQQWV